MAKQPNLMHRKKYIKKEARIHYMYTLDSVKWAVICNRRVYMICWFRREFYVIFLFPFYIEFVV